MRPVATQPDSWIEKAPERCTVTREIDASPARIWEVLADHEAWPEWFEAVEGVEVTGEATGLGARRRVHLAGLDVDEEFVAWDVGERFAFTAVAMSRPILVSLNERVTITELATDRSRVTYTQAFAPSWWLRPVFPLLKRRFRRGLEEALENLAGRFG